MILLLVLNPILYRQIIHQPFSPFRSANLQKTGGVSKLFLTVSLPLPCKTVAFS
jgi:hypothetical protein